MRVIICGGRDFRDAELFVANLHAFHDALGPITEVVSGGATGADLMGEEFARQHGIPVQRFPTDWAKHGRAAGPRRNAEMAAYVAGQAEQGAFIVFPGGRGTADMERRATDAQLIIWRSTRR